MSRGELTARQAKVIQDAVQLLPDAAGDPRRQACETQLVDDARRLDLPTLARRADRVAAGLLEHSTDPEVVDAGEDAIVAAREQRAWNSAEFWMGPAVDGRVKGGFTVPEAQAAALEVALDALCAPQVTITGPGRVTRTTDDVPTLLDQRPSHSRRRGWAFTHLCELLPTDRLPQTNGAGAVLTVALDHGILTDRLATATLGTGQRLSAGQTRRLACHHRLLPAVFDGESLPLDLGRSKRLFTTHQHHAIGLRDRGCVFPGCDRPPGWTVVHHARRRWADGGTTDLADGVSLCPHHHRTLHTDGWDVEFTAHGIPELVPPASLDPTRRPRHHARFDHAG